MQPIVCAVIVTYFPNKKVLTAQLTALLPQVTRAIIVDNGSNGEALASLTELVSQFSGHVELQCLTQNLGIAKAQNIGIAQAKAQGAEFVLLMDQDSLPTESMVNQLLQSHQRLTNLGYQVSAVGPLFKDAVSGRLSKHVRFGCLSVSRVSCADGCDVVPVDFLIASGSLISLEALAVIGNKDEGLFIDHVDTEWIVRARAMGWLAFGHCNAVMMHSLGEHRIRFWLGRWRDIPVHKPFRYYYIFRNSLVLRKRDYMGWHWKWVDLIRLVQIVIFMGIVANERRLKIKMIWRGIVAGIRGDQGKMPENDAC